jgi:hypothetical protein
MPSALCVGGIRLQIDPLPNEKPWAAENIGWCGTGGE